MGTNTTSRRRTAAAFIAGVSMAVVGAFAVQTFIAGAAGSNSDESSFVSMEPCRLADTRPTENIGPNTTFGTNDTKMFQATGTNGQCSIPSDVVGLSLNVTAVLATMSTYVTVWPEGTKPNASSLNPEPGQVAFNAVTTPLSATGSFLVYNLQGNVDVIIDINGYYSKTALSELDERVAALEDADIPQSVFDRLDALEAENAALKTLTASMTFITDPETGQPTVRFTGVNVQVVDGSGDTYGDVNGTGNLIIGYNEHQGPVADEKTGSHNLVVGHGHTYTSYNGLVTGADNTIMAAGASITAGYANIASAPGASISGGAYNTASGGESSVSGGTANTASEMFSSVSGGYRNTASGWQDSIIGGDDITCTDGTTGNSQSIVCGEGTIDPAD